MTWWALGFLMGKKNDLVATKWSSIIQHRNDMVVARFLSGKKNKPKKKNKKTTSWSLSCPW
jgi:hypothetical protein